MNGIEVLSGRTIIAWQIQRPQAAKVLSVIQRQQHQVLNGAIIYRLIKTCPNFSLTVQNNNKAFV